MSDQPIVHAFDEAGRVVQEGVQAASTLKDKAIAVLQGLPVEATKEHIVQELSALFVRHETETAPAHEPPVTPAPPQVEGSAPPA